MDDGFAVVSEVFELQDREPLEAAFRDVLGMVAYDARQRARRARGIVAENLDADQAQALVARLAPRYGLHVLEQRHVPDLRRPRRVQRLRVDGPTFEIGEGYHEDFESCDWSRVLLLSAAVIHVRNREVKSEVQSRSTGDEIDSGFSRYRTRVEYEEWDDVIADVVSSGVDAPYTEVRLRSTELAYQQILGDAAYVDPGRNAGEAVRDSFCIVLARIGRRATSALVTPQTRALLVSRKERNRRLPDAARFEDEAAFRDWNRWLIASRRLREATG